MKSAAEELGIDFYLVGAIARDHHLSKSEHYKISRKTADIDIAVMVADEDEFHLLKQTLIAKGNFEEGEDPIQLIYANTAEIDLLPFGDIEVRGETHLTRPRAFVMDVPGFALLNSFTEQMVLSEKHTVRVCELEGIVILKLLAWDDRNERTKDILDINQIVDSYFNIESDTVFDEHNDVTGFYDPNELHHYTSKVSAHVIGRKMKNILKSEELLQERIISILKKERGKYWKQILAGLTE